MSDYIPTYQDLSENFPLGSYKLPEAILADMNKVTAVFGPYLCAMVDFFKAINGVEGKGDRRDAHRPMKYCMDRMDTVLLRHQSGGVAAAGACSGHVLENFHPPLTRAEFVEAMRLQLCMDFAYDVMQNFGPVAAATMQVSAIELAMNSLRMMMYRLLLNIVDEYLIQCKLFSYCPTEFVDFRLDIEQTGKVIYVKGIDVEGYIMNKDGSFKAPKIPDARKN